MDWFKHENCYVHMNSFCGINLWFRKFNTTTDILYGRNQSCRALKKNFNVPHGVYYIHPWRDERKIKVDCFGKILIDWLIEFFSTTYGWTMSLCILSIFTSFFKIYRKTEKHYVSIFFARYGLCVTDTDLKNGHNLYSRNYRADSAFLNTLDKLIFLRKIAFICRHWNGTHQVNYRLAGNTKAYNFFALNSDERPTSDSMTLTSELGSTDYKLADGKYSDPSVNDQNRLVREIFVTAGGIKFDIMADSRICFYNVGSWIQFFVEFW